MKDKTQVNVKKENNFEKEVLKQNAPLKKPTLSKDYFTLHNEYLNLKKQRSFYLLQSAIKKSVSIWLVQS